MNRRKLLLKGYNFKESEHDRFGKRPAANAAEKIDERSTEADVSAFRRSIGLFCFFVFFFLRSSENFRFAFLALNVSSQYFTWKISICSAKSNHVFRCSLSGELATGRARLRTSDRVAESQLQLTSVNRKSSAFSSAGFVRRLESRSWKVRLGLQSYSICLHSISQKMTCWLFKMCPSYKKQRYFDEVVNSNNWLTIIQRSQL